MCHKMVSTCHVDVVFAGCPMLLLCMRVSVWFCLVEWYEAFARLHVLERQLTVLPLDLTHCLEFLQ
jgi:hypothetical protein